MEPVLWGHSHLSRSPRTSPCLRLTVNSPNQRGMNCLCTEGGCWKEFTTLGAAGPEVVSGRGGASPRRIATLAVQVETSEAEQLEQRRPLGCGTHITPPELSF